jgi:exodeoxyribonuclease X
MLIRVIDFETTGVPEMGGPHPAAICEVGWTDIVIDSMGPRIESKGERLCDPGYPMPVEAMAVHHITDAMIAKGGCAGERADPPAVALRRILEDSPDYFAAHNAQFEQHFFPQPKPEQWICTYKSALRVWPEAPGHSNQVLRYFLGLDLPELYASPPHRAGPDSYVTAHILASMLRLGTKIEDMVRWSSGPALLPRVTFGKHRGSRWEDVPTDYLEWVAFKSEMDADAKANARHHLKRRGATA